MNGLMRFFLVMLCISLILVNRPFPAQAAAAAAKGDVTDDMLKKTSMETMKALQNGDLKELSQQINQKQGLVFSLSPQIKKDNGVLLSQQQLVNLSSGKSKSEKIDWGTDDAKGEPVELTFEEFKKQYLWPVNFLGKDIVVTCSDIPQRGSSPQNYKSRFKNGIAVEYYYGGTKKNHNMDWRAIILIYEKVNNQLCLSAVIIDHWRT